MICLLFHWGPPEEFTHIFYTGVLYILFEHFVDLTWKKIYMESITMSCYIFALWGAPGEGYLRMYVYLTWGHPYTGITNTGVMFKYLVFCFNYFLASSISEQVYWVKRNVTIALKCNQGLIRVFSFNSNQMSEIFLLYIDTSKYIFLHVSHVQKLIFSSFFTGGWSIEKYEKGYYFYRE